MNTPIPYRPSAYYFRQELRSARTKKEAIIVGLMLVSELEELKAWVREHGLIPPRFNVTPSERLAKADLLAFPYASTEASSPQDPRRESTGARDQSDSA